MKKNSDWKRRMFGYVLYKMYDDAGKEMPLQMFPETAHLIDFGISGDLMLAVPMKFLNSTKYKKQKRGKALFEGKTDVLDGLDEVISQWIDAIRMGRIKAIYSGQSDSERSDHRRASAGKPI